MVHNGFTDQGPTIGTPCIARFNFLRSQDSLRLKLDFFVIFPGAYVGLMLVGLEPARMMHRLPVLSSGQTVNTCRSEQSVEEIRLSFGKSELVAPCGSISTRSLGSRMERRSKSKSLLNSAIM